MYLMFLPTYIGRQTFARYIGQSTNCRTVLCEVPDLLASRAQMHLGASFNLFLVARSQLSIPIPLSVWLFFLEDIFCFAPHIKYSPRPTPLVGDPTTDLSDKLVLPSGPCCRRRYVYIYLAMRLFHVQLIIPLSVQLPLVGPVVSLSPCRTGSIESIVVVSFVLSFSLHSNLFKYSMPFILTDYIF